jgi:hypothetical protein
MDEIDCLQVEIIELEQKIIDLKKLVDIKLKNNIIAYSKSSLNNNVGEKKVEKNSNTLLHSSKQEYYHYVNALGLS